MAAEIWELLDGTYSLSQIIAILQERFEIEKEIMERDVLNFIKELLRREIIH